MSSLLLPVPSLRGEDPSWRCVSGVYPHLAYWNSHNECGTGAVVPWADDLWVITYAPHFPQGSSDKLYRIDPGLRVEQFAGSVGGTPANRMVHRETNQLLIGPYVIDGSGNVRVIPPSKMYGRLTGTARHLFEPARKVYYATMEEGIYEVDLDTLAVTELFRDDQHGIPGGRSDPDGSGRRFAELPGYHGKGLFSGQGRLIYANNGEASAAARKRPDVPSGCLAEWDGKSDSWRVIRRNQFTDVRGPGGIYGNANPDSDPVWAVGWDHRSLLLMLLDEGEWYTYRLPKASHTYDGAHGWNTEWPRIHDVGEDDLVMNMHGMFWRFPRTFSRENSAGLLPRSTYLKVLGDYCRWGDQLVFGCDDTAKSEFLNKRRAKGNLAAPGVSHSNLWFTPPSVMDELGPELGRGAVWVNDNVEPGKPSDPFLFAGFARRGVHIEHDTSEEVTFVFEVDRLGNDEWRPLKSISVPGQSSAWVAFDQQEPGVWLRVSTNRPCNSASVQFNYSGRDNRTPRPDAIFAGLANDQSIDVSGGIVWVRGGDAPKLCFAASSASDGELSQPKYYELDAQLNLRAARDAERLEFLLDKCAIPEGVLTYDAASAIYIDDDGNRWRLPRGHADWTPEGPLGAERCDREVMTERDLFNCSGIFYELPARNAGGFAKLRPVCTHNARIKDYCSYRGLLVMTGVDADAPAGEHIIRSADGSAALWVGVVDDLWKFGKPRGIGGPWLDSDVTAGEPSDPYLMTGFDKKTVSLSHGSDEKVGITLQVNIDGDRTWEDFHTYTVEAGETLTQELPTEFGAYWVRAVADHDCTATLQLRYE